MGNYCILNGIYSNELTGLLVSSLPPISKPLMRTQIETIDGRDGDIVTNLGYSAYDKQMEIGLYGDYDIDEIIAFFASEGTVTFSNEPDKYYHYTIVDQIDFERLVRYRKATVTFHCQPFKYDATETEIDFTNTFTEDNVPYIFRANPHDANMMKLKKVVGGTIAWNQLLENVLTSYNNNGVTASYSNGVYTFSGTATSDISIPLVTTPQSIIGHKYLRGYTFGSASTYFLYGGGMVVRSYLTPQIYEATTSVPMTLSLRVLSGTNVDGVKFTLNVFDLTQMFGSTIADYIYSLEQAHAGDGVAWFKALFPKAYYAYNAGELMHASGVSEHVMSGKNLFDISSRTISTSSATTSTIYCESCTAVKNGESIVATATGAWAKMHYVIDTSKLVVGHTYTWSAKFNNPSGARVAVACKVNTESWQTSLTSTDASAKSSITYTHSANTNTLKFSTIVDNVPSTSNKVVTVSEIQLELGDTATEYKSYHEPYHYPLDSSLTLRGIPKLDSANNLYYDGDTYASDGTVTRRYGVIDLGTLNWSYSGSFFNISLAGIEPPSWARNGNEWGICQKYIIESWSSIDLGTLTDKSLHGLVYNGYLTLRVYDSSYTDASTFISAMNGVYLVYEMTTPTTESADAYTQSQRVGATEEFVDGRTVEIPVGNNTLYYDGTPEIVVTNAGNAISKPILTIYGSGDITVSLNSNQIFSIALGDYEYITIDTNAMEAYMGGVLLNRLVTGDYADFSLAVGDNTLSFTGDVSEVLIENYSRWI